jgi:carboxylate-amine ligase
MRYSTVEFRVADVCTDLDDAVLHAGLVRSLVRVLADRATRGEPCPEPPCDLLRVARWRAARHGVSGRLFDPLTSELVAAPVAVLRLLEELEDDLRDSGEWDELSCLAGQVLRRGTSATAQRRILGRTGDPRAVAAALVGASRC